MCAHKMGNLFDMVFTHLLPVVSSFNVQSIVLFAAVFLATIAWIRRPKNLPPGPTGWPIIGNLFDMQKGPLHHVLTGWARQYGSVISFKMGTTIAVALNDISSVKEAVVKQADCFSDRLVPTAIAKKILPPEGSFTSSNGEPWKQLRRFGLSAMRNLGVGKRAVQHKINEESRYLLESFDCEGEKPFDPGHAIQNAVSNIICLISFGYRFEYSDPSFKYLIDSVKKIFSRVSLAAAPRIFPFLLRLPIYNERREMMKKIINFIHGIVQEHQESFDENDIRDFIDMYIMAIKNREQGKKGDLEAALSDETIWRGILDLFLAGTDTTTNTLMWLLLYMAIYPDVQKRVQKEIDDVIGSDRPPVLEDRNALPYANAVLMEMQRVRPVAPNAVPHQTNYETELLGYTIPAKTTVFVNLWAVLHDPKRWKDPEEFDPTRFLSEDGKTVEKPEAFIPFGIGRRVCLGESLAKMEMFLFFVNLMQRFTFTLPSDRPRPPMDGIAGVTLGPHPYEILATKR